jgi:hypothetical protein
MVEPKNNVISHPNLLFQIYSLMIVKLHPPPQSKEREELKKIHHQTLQRPIHEHPKKFLYMLLLLFEFQDDL